jgi:hypothetical protein
MKVHIHKKPNAHRARGSEWDPILLARVQSIAEGLPRATLFLFWLEHQAEESDLAFMAWLQDLASWSKQDLIDIIHEMGPAAGRQFLDRFDTSG